MKLFEPKLKWIAVGVAICAALSLRASADELTDALASLRRAMVGHWSGTVTGTDASGEQFEVDDDFTFVVTSEDGLDSATWNAGMLEIATHEGNGRYRVRGWDRAGGRRGGTEYRIQIVDEPDAAGNGAWVLELRQTGADGTVMDTHEYFTLDADTLRMDIRMRPAGSDEPFETVITGEWIRVAN